MGYDIQYGRRWAGRISWSSVTRIYGIRPENRSYSGNLPSNDSKMTRMWEAGVTTATFFGIHGMIEHTTPVAKDFAGISFPPRYRPHNCLSTQAGSHPVH
jgi:hypothetical protein